jgi:hypothetical protein
MMSIFDNVAAPARFNGLVKGRRAEEEPWSGASVRRPVDEVSDKPTTAERHLPVSSNGCDRPSPSLALDVCHGRAFRASGTIRRPHLRSRSLGELARLHDRHRDPQHAAGGGLE